MNFVAWGEFSLFGLMGNKAAVEETFLVDVSEYT